MEQINEKVKISELTFLRQFNMEVVNFLFFRDLNKGHLELPEKMTYDDWVDSAFDYLTGHGLTNPDND